MPHSLDEKMDDQLIILAHDGTDVSDYAVEYYLDRIHRLGNRLLLLHCIELPEMDQKKAKSMHMSPGVLASMWKEEEHKTRKLEESMRSLLKTRGLKGELRTTTGRPNETICRIAEEEDAALIVTGSRGNNQLKRTILGSLSDYLVHHATCPVIVCRHPSSMKKRRSSSTMHDTKKFLESLIPRSGSEGSRSRNASGDMSSEKRDKLGFMKQRHMSAPAPESAKSHQKPGNLEKMRHKSAYEAEHPSSHSQRVRFGKFKFRSVSLGSESDEEQ